MKRPKKAKVIVETYTGKIFSVQCPHCLHISRGGFNDDHISIKCFNCKNPIILIF